jgi:predicted GTPase
MQGKIGPEDLFDADLLYIFQYIEESKAPIHFVITKWDVLQPHYPFEAIRKQLLAYRDFHDVVVTASRTQRIVRLIPVSAVGLGSFELQTDDTIVTYGCQVGTIPA